MGVNQVRLGQAINLFTFRVDGEAVPNSVNAFGFEFSFFSAPIDGLEFNFHVQAFAGFASQINVHANDFVLFVTEAHRSKVVVQTNNDFFRAAATATGNHHNHHHETHE